MRVWLVEHSEPLPIDGPERLLRMGVLADQLVREGHQVVWWTGTFHHNRKAHRFPGDRTVDINESYQLRLLHTRGYRKHVSLARIIDHRQAASKFAKAAERSEPADVVLASMPTPGLALASVRYGRKHNVPVVVDMQDMWPETFLRFVPDWLHWAGRIALWPMERELRKASAGATAICGITEEFVDWGLTKAGRGRTDLDRAFPHAYPDRKPDDEAVEQAKLFWAEHGVSGDPGKFVCCYFGRVNFHEFETVLDAARILEGERLPFRFVLCGTGDAFEHFKEISHDLSSVVFPGWVNYPQIWTLMRMSSVGLAPFGSTKDYRASIPNKPIEYLSASLPVVSSLRGVLEQTLAEHECGVTYENGDAEALARILAELHAAPERLTRMSANASELFEQRFVARKVYHDMIQYLGEVAATKDGRPAESRQSDR